LSHDAAESQQKKRRNDADCDADRETCEPDLPGLGLVTNTGIGVKDFIVRPRGPKLKRPRAPKPAQNFNAAWR
jgi:hypothetical protein